MALITLNKLALPTGSVLQVVSNQYSTETSSTSTTISSSIFTSWNYRSSRCY